jgi:hypothetical protein
VTEEHQPCRRFAMGLCAHRRMAQGPVRRSNPPPRGGRCRARSRVPAPPPARADASPARGPCVAPRACNEASMERRASARDRRRRRVRVEQRRVQPRSPWRARRAERGTTDADARRRAARRSDFIARDRAVQGMSAGLPGQCARRSLAWGARSCRRVSASRARERGSRAGAGHPLGRVHRFVGGVAHSSGCAREERRWARDSAGCGRDSAGCAGE